MIDHKNLLDAFLEGRFWIWEGTEKCVVYENLPEEGERVKKKIGSFETKEEAIEFLAEHKVLYKEYLCKVLKVSSGPGMSSTKVVPSPPSTSITKSSLEKKRKKTSTDTSTPQSASESTTPSPQQDVPPTSSYPENSS